MGNKSIVALLFAAAAGCTDSSSAITTAASQQAVSTSSAQVASNYLRNARPIHARQAPHTAASGGITMAAKAQSGIDTLINFSSSFTAPGFDGDGNPQSVWPYTMVGRAPEQNRTTRFDNSIIPVTVELLDASGKVGTTATGAPLRMVTGQDTINLTLNSPVFQKSPTTAGNVQITDGVMRSEFFFRAGDGDGDRDDQGYHTILDPHLKTARTIQLPFGTYQVAPRADGTCCLFVLADINVFANLIFPPTADDTTTVMGAAEHAGDMKTTDITTLLFRDLFLTEGGGCCVLGFHSVDVEPGTKQNGNRERDFVMAYARYISDGLFGGGFEDVTALSHEIAELFNDPFINNATPWWLSIDPFNPQNALCQNNLETGDVIEVLSANPVAQVPLHNRTYHPQNEALLPWFAFESPSSAHLGAYSFPDETTIQSLSPGPLLPGCVPAN
ncbi:MAG TPA: hypothetical protein VHW23_36855 [Kofleriaceae bacterium]|nr:hypothetical protein [Kofleriaceae bacterium]